MRAPFPQWIVIYVVFVPWRSVFHYLAMRSKPAQLESEPA
jgi:hypothetical protein